MNEHKHASDRPVEGSMPAPVLARAEEAVDRALCYLGAFGTVAGRRLRAMAEPVRAEAQARAARTAPGADNTPPRTLRQSGSASAAPDDGRAPVARAEDTVDRVGQQISRVSTAAGLNLMRLGARAREEAEDIWAEAASLRRRPGP